MATITETEVRVEVRLTRRLAIPPGGGAPVVQNGVAVSAQSFDAAGAPVRRFLQADLFPELSAARQDQVTGILDTAINYVKNQLGIA